MKNLFDNGELGRSREQKFRKTTGSDLVLPQSLY